jgi:hypothetical protein
MVRAKGSTSGRPACEARSKRGSECIAISLDKLLALEAVSGETILNLRLRNYLKPNIVVYYSFEKAG